MVAERITFEQIGKPANNPLLSPAWKTTGLVFTSGATGVDYSTNTLPEDLAEQTENTIKNLKEVLEAAGSSLDKVLKVLLLISDGKDAKIVNEIYGKYFTNKPARSCIIVGFPNPKLKVEIECVAEY